MSVFRAAPYNLVRGNDLNARVKATNSQGTSALWSTVGSGATVQTEPVKMAIPTRGPDTSEAKLDVDWLALTGTDTGDSAILSYVL